MKNIIKRIKELSASEVSNIVYKGGIYLLAFLIPIFFLPFTSNILDFNKQFLLVITGTIVFFAWMVNSLVLGRIKLNVTFLHIPVLALFTAYFSSAIFSVWSYGSFWGWPFPVSESVITLFFLAFLYFLISNSLKKKEILYVLALSAFSGFLALLLGTFQLFGKFILPWDFTKIASFNTIGAVNSLGILAAILLPLSIMMLIFGKKGLRILSGLLVITAALVLAIVNSFAAWWVVIAGTSLIILLGTQRKDFFDSRWLVLPMFFLVLSASLLFISFRVPGLAERPTEVSLNQETSADIAFKTLKENPVLGSGPGTYTYSFLKHKDIGFNEGNLWNFKFDRASSKALTLFTGTGILGGISFIILLLLFAIYGIKNLFFKSSLLEEKGEWLIASGAFAGFFALSVSFFLHPSSLVLDFFFFLFIGAIAGFLASSKKEIELKSSSLLTLATTFILVIMSVFGIGIIIISGQRYIAEASYTKGVRELRGGNIESAIERVESAVKINPDSDLYWRELSQVYLQKVNMEIAKSGENTTEEEAQRIQTFIRSAMNTVKKATDINPKNAVNWTIRGHIYQSFIGIVEDSKEWAVKSFEEASNLEPVNPYYPTQAGISILTLYSMTEEGNESLLEEAESKFKEAQKLKSDYTPALYQMAMVYSTRGETDEAIKELEEAKKAAPFDTGLAFQLGITYYNNENYEKAKAELEKVISLQPNYANALYFLGLTYDKLGNKERAINRFERVRELNPENEEVRRIIENLKEGKSALEEQEEELPASLPIEESPEEMIEE